MSPLVSDDFLLKFKFKHPGNSSCDIAIAKPQKTSKPAQATQTRSHKKVESLYRAQEINHRAIANKVIVQSKRTFLLNVLKKKPNLVQNIPYQAVHPAANKGSRKSSSV